MLISFTMNKDERFILDPTSLVNLSTTFHQDLLAISCCNCFEIVNLGQIQLILFDKMGYSRL